jgi:F-type H+-transporting ATPase subunit b
MPQLDPTSFPSQLFWLTVSFVVLYILLARFLLPRVHSVLALRSWTMESDIEQAGRMKSEAENARAQYEKGLADARIASQSILTDAQHALGEKAAKQQAELDVAIEKKMVESESAIIRAKQEVMGKLAPVSAELASLIVEVLVHYKPNPKDITDVVNELAKERLA